MKTVYTFFKRIIFRQEASSPIGKLQQNKNFAFEKQHSKSAVGQTTLQDKVKEDLCLYFKKDEPYLNPELSLTDIANALNVNATYLSRLINREFNMNFYAFINKHRIDYAISMVKGKNIRITSEALSAVAGFKSRSVFYKQFQKRTGFTPKEYIRITSTPPTFPKDNIQ